MYLRPYIDFSAQTPIGLQHRVGLVRAERDRQLVLVAELVELLNGIGGHAEDGGAGLGELRRKGCEKSLASTVQPDVSAFG